MLASMDRPLDSAFNKLARAQAHAEALRGAISEYLQLDPFQVEVVRAEGKIVYRLRVRRPPPTRLSLIAGDAIQNARTALDHLVCGLAERETGREARRHRHLTFPIYERESEYRGQIESDTFRTTLGAAQVVFGSLQAFGDAPLRRLHRLNIRDKHRTLLAAATARVEVQALLGRESMQNLGHGAFLSLPHVSMPGGPLYDGDTVLILDGDEPFEVAPRFIFDVGLDEPDIVPCRPLYKLTIGLLEEVQRVLDMFASA